MNTECEKQSNYIINIWNNFDEAGTGKGAKLCHFGNG